MAPPVHRGLLSGKAHAWLIAQASNVPVQSAVQRLAVPAAASAAVREPTSCS